MRVILLGAPGSGKGTQGALLSQRLDIPHVSSGELLRDHMDRGTVLGEQVGSYVRRGELVPNDLLLDVLFEATRAAMERGGCIMDGFPRTFSQAELAYEIARSTGETADAVIHLVVPDGAVRQRLSARAVEGRPDDADPAVIDRRLAIYHGDTDPLLDFYRERGILVDVDAAGPTADVALGVLAALRHRGLISASSVGIGATVDDGENVREATPGGREAKEQQS